MSEIKLEVIPTNREEAEQEIRRLRGIVESALESIAEIATKFDIYTSLNIAGVYFDPDDQEWTTSSANC